MITGASLFTESGALLFTDYISPTEWMSDVLSKIYSYSNGKGNIEDLLPHEWAKNQNPA